MTKQYSKAINMEIRIYFKQNLATAPTFLKIFCEWLRLQTFCDFKFCKCQKTNNFEVLNNFELAKNLQMSNFLKPYSLVILDITWYNFANTWCINDMDKIFILTSHSTNFAKLTKIPLSIKLLPFFVIYDFCIKTTKQNSY